MKLVIKKIIILIIILAVLFVIFGVVFNMVFRTISYSFYRNAKQYSQIDKNIIRLEIGENKDLIGYAKSSDFSSKKKAVIYFGGSGEIAYNAVYDRSCNFEDCVFICADYPGSQESKGKMNLKTMQKASLDLYDYIKTLIYVDADNICIAGYSYGSGIAVYLASQRLCTHLVIIAPYRDITDLYNKIIPVFHSHFAWFITDNIDTKAYSKTVSARTLIITSDADKTIDKSIPYSLSEYFSDAKIIEISGCAHDSYFESDEAVETIKDFLK